MIFKFWPLDFCSLNNKINSLFQEQPVQNANLKIQDTDVSSELFWFIMPESSVIFGERKKIIYVLLNKNNNMRIDCLRGRYLTDF